MKKLIAVALAFTMASALASCEKKSAQANEASYIYGQISAISGNDITLKLAEYNESSGEDDSKKNKTDSDDGSDTDSKSSRPSGSRPSGDFSIPDDFSMPDGGFQKPDGDFSILDDFSMPDGGFKKPDGDFSRPDGAPDGDSDFSGKQFNGNKNFGSSEYTLTGEEEDIRIPVGTKVTTKLGVETNFDALKSGDMIKCSVEEQDGTQVVTEIWIVG